jgi:hypothetical protein
MWLSQLLYDGRFAVGQFVQATIWDLWPIFLSLFLDIFLRQLRICRVCSFQLMFGLTNAVYLVSESRGTNAHV